MKLAIIGYVPPPHVGNPATFLANVNKFKRSTDLVLYSDHDWPDVMKLRHSPEFMRNARFPDGQTVNKFAVQNTIFFTGLRIALLKGYTHYITLEDDVRVGRDDWDSLIWEEYFGFGRPLIASGTLVCYNPCNWSRLAVDRWQDLLKKNLRRNFPIATYGYTGAGQVSSSCLFPNGALAVYDVRWLCKLYNLHEGSQIPEMVRSLQAWDMDIGFQVWKEFEESSYDFMAHSDEVFSGYGNIVTTEDERKKMLTDHKVVAVHQIKTNWAP